jgi:ferredoxin
VTFVDKGEKILVEAKEGESILQLARTFNIELEGACEGSLSCSTCHVILEDQVYQQLKNPTDEENDMLDLAFGAHAEPGDAKHLKPERPSGQSGGSCDPDW